MREELKVKINEKRLSEFGFIKTDNYYKYEKNVMNDFILIVKVYENEIIFDAYDTFTNDKYLMFYTNNSSSIVGLLREECNKIISYIKEYNEEDIFKEKQSKMISDYIFEKYNDKLEFLFKNLPECAIARNKKNNKWYLTISRNKKSVLGVNSDEIIEIINLKIETDRIESIVDNERYFKGYHMNKKHWITIILDGSVPIEEIYKLIDNSYRLTNIK